MGISLPGPLGYTGRGQNQTARVAVNVMKRHLTPGTLHRSRFVLESSCGMGFALSLVRRSSPGVADGCRRWVGCREDCPRKLRVGDPGTLERVHIQVMAVVREARSLSKTRWGTRKQLIVWGCQQTSRQR